MAHFTRELDDEEYYVGKTTGLHTVVRNIDEKLTDALNDSTGSATYAPSAPIIIGGEGIELMATMDLACSSFGGYQISPGAGKYIKFGDDDYFQFGTAHARTIQQWAGFAVASGNLPHDGFSSGWISTLRKFARVFIPLRKLPNGQRLQSVNVFVNDSCRGRLVRHLANGNVEPIVMSTTDVDGWCSPSSSAVGVNTATPSPGLLIDTTTAEYGFEVQALTANATEVRYVEMVVWYYDMRFQ